MGQIFRIPSGKLTGRNGKPPFFYLSYIFKWWISHCYVGLPECIGSVGCLVHLGMGQDELGKLVGEFLGQHQKHLAASKGAFFFVKDVLSTIQ